MLKRKEQKYVIDTEMEITIDDKVEIRELKISNAKALKMQSLGTKFEKGDIDYDEFVKFLGLELFGLSYEELEQTNDDELIELFLALGDYINKIPR